MKPLSMLSFIMIAILVGGCGPSESAKRVQSLRTSDFERIHEAVVTLCAGYDPVPQEKSTDSHDDGRLLYEAEIPQEFAFLNPQAIRHTDTWATIYLYKTPAGEDSITVGKDKEGVWTIRTHIGDWMNPESDVIWSSKRGSNQSPETRTTSGPV